MIAINFKAKFADLVASGKKTQTIRQTNRFKVGDTLQLYTGQRTKACRKLGEAVVKTIFKISITETNVEYANLDYISVCGKGREKSLGGREYLLNNFAQKDGFKDFEEMKAFFVAQYGDLPFEGYLIQWELKGGE
ncbi:MAG: ASCH domain-containing protein [Bacteroidota bacterium]|jgi:hypothetical protein